MYCRQNTPVSTGVGEKTGFWLTDSDVESVVVGGGRSAPLPELVVKRAVFVWLLVGGGQGWQTILLMERFDICKGLTQGQLIICSLDQRDAVYSKSLSVYTHT